MATPHRALVGQNRRVSPGFVTPDPFPETNSFIAYSSSVGHGQ
jgi:hypothetical protein